MELKHYLVTLLRWWWLVVLVTLASGGAAYLVSKRSAPVYQASTTLLIDQTPADGSTIDLNSLRTSEELASTYVALLYKRPVLEGVAAALRPPIDIKELAGKIRVATVRDTQLIVITVEDRSPERAAQIANEVVQVFKQQNRELGASRYASSKQNLEQELLRSQASIDQLDAQVAALATASSPEQVQQRNQLRVQADQQRHTYATILKSYEQVRVAAAQTIDNLNVVEQAVPEPAPIRPRPLMNTLLAAIVGIMLGIGLIFLIGYVDSSVKSGQQLEELIGLVTLASIARIRGSSAEERLVTVADGSSVITEAYRMLRVNLDFATIDRPLRTLAITSSLPGEGKSTTTANLAVIFARSGRRVILVDADLRRPTLHTFFRRSNERGLTSALLQQAADPVESYLVETGVQNLLLLPSGPLPPNPAELLGSHRMAELVAALKGHADLVIFDSPPVLAVADTLVLTQVCDALLLVVLAGSTRTEALRKSHAALQQAGARLLGAVLNRAPGSGVSHYQAYFAGEPNHRHGLKRWSPRLGTLLRSNGAQPRFGGQSRPMLSAAGAAAQRSKAGRRQHGARAADDHAAILQRWQQSDALRPYGAAASGEPQGSGEAGALAAGQPEPADRLYAEPEALERGQTVALPISHSAKPATMPQLHGIKQRQHRRDKKSLS